MKQLLQGIKIFIILSVLTGIIYPLAVTGLARVFFKNKAEGSIITGNTGSALVAQSFTEAKYFWPRPSAGDYNTMSSAASNLTPVGEKVKANMLEYRNKFQNEQGETADEMLFTSGSGLDPHISPQSALYQAQRIASARGMQLEAVNTLIKSHTEGRTFGFLGEERVNVLKLNIALDTYEK